MDNNEAGNLKQSELTKLPPELESNSQDRKSLLNFDFKGDAKIQFENRQSLLRSYLLSEADYANLIHLMNQQSSEISEQIVAEIKSQLKGVGFDVSVNIEFRSGSLLWVGIITVTDFLSKLDGTVGGAKVIIDAAKFAINKVIRKRVEDDQGAVVKDINTDVKLSRTTEKDQTHPFTKLLWWCGGGIKEILRHCPEDKFKYQTIGAAVLTTGLLAFFSGGYAFYTMFDGGAYAEWYGAGFGLFWALIIFNIDRSIVTSMRKGDETQTRWSKLKGEFGPAIPRFAMAVILGFIISKPLELRFFQNQISTKFENNKREESGRFVDSLRSGPYKARLNEVTPNLGRLANELKTAEEEVNKLRQIFNEEMDARGGTRTYGYGEVAREKKRALVAAEKRLDSLRKEFASEETKSRQNTKLLALEQEIEGKRAEFEKGMRNDFSERLQALWDLTNEKRGVYWANLAIIILLIFIELTPLLVKLFSRSGVYDARLNMKESIAREEARLRQQAEVRVAEIKSSAVIDDARQIAGSASTETALRTDAVQEVARNRYQAVINAEQTLNERFFELSLASRQRVMERRLDTWEQSTQNGDPRPFNDFYKEKERTLAIDLRG